MTLAEDDRADQKKRHRLFLEKFEKIQTKTHFRPNLSPIKPSLSFVVLVVLYCINRGLHSSKEYSNYTVQVLSA